MKLSKPVYIYGRDTLHVNIFSAAGRFTTALNLLDIGWIDHTFAILQHLLPRFDWIVTDTDLLAHDDYIKHLRDTHIVFLVRTDGKLAANYGRLNAAATKLRAAGIKVRYFASMKSLNKTLERL